MNSLIRSAIVCPDYFKEYPRVTHGKGVYLYDEIGKQYIDASSGSAAVSNIGHGNDEIAELMKRQASKVSILPTHAFSSEIVENYLFQLVDFAKSDFGRAWTVSSGTEAIENALKLAMHYHNIKGDSKRYKIVSRNISYHGNSIFMLDIGGMPTRKEPYKKWMNNPFPHISAANVYRKPDDFTESDYVDSLVDEFEQTLIKGDPSTFAALVIEPVVAAAMGAVPAPKGYMERMYAICKKYGLLFIVDEVLTGFGRIGSRLGIEKFNVVPDIIALGKGISGGYFPLSAIIASQKIMEPFLNKNTSFLAGHTYTCNPLGAAIGQYVIEYIKNFDIVHNAEDKGRYLKEKLAGLYKYEIVGDIRGEGLLLGVEFVKDRKTKKPFPSEVKLSRVISELSFKEGIVLYPGNGSFDGQSGDHILITPPLVINESQCDLIVDALELSIRQILNNGIK